MARRPKNTGATPRRPHPLRYLRSHPGMAGRIAVVALALVLSIIPVIFINNAMSYVPLFSLVFIILVSYLYLRLLKGRLEYSEDSMIASCERGREIEFAVDFANTSPLVFVSLEAHFYMTDLFGNPDGNLVSTMTLMPYEKKTLHFDAQFDHIGTYSAGLEKVVISDLLGLFTCTVENKRRHEVVVLPQLFDVETLELSDLSAEESKHSFRPIISDDMDYVGVRDYEPGDPLKTIHWKLSARTADETYFTRLFETFGSPGLDIVIDSSAPAYDSEPLMQVFDGVMEAAVSLNDYALRAGVDSELYFVNELDEPESTHVTGIAGFAGLIDKVPRIKVRSCDESLELLRRRINSNHGKGNIAFVTAHVNNEIVTALVEARMRKRNPVLFVVVPRGLEGDGRRQFLAPLRRLEASQISYYVITSASELGGGKA